MAAATCAAPMAQEFCVSSETNGLLTNLSGKDLLKLHRKISPPIAQFITEHPNLKSIVRVSYCPLR
jgi:hypothetical protein